ncbi:MAG TPA: hypothetical protein VFW17_08800 [Ktedonobacterales bacterium]|jgi:hypothetical protein|nr:hypothetical protein [Ktedonobacterales bacterium]
MRQSEPYAEGNAPFMNYVIAVLDTPEDGQEVAEALKAHGFADADIALSSPLNQHTPPEQQEQGTLADPPTTTQRLFTEEGLDQAEYATAREQGQVVIQVHTPESEDVERAHAILVAHQARTIKRVGTWTRENLPSK